jgi:hypothetical protein
MATMDPLNMRLSCFILFGKISELFKNFPSYTALIIDGRNESFFIDLVRKNIVLERCQTLFIS